MTGNGEDPRETPTENGSASSPESAVRDALFAGVETLCDDAVGSTSLDGAAVAVPKSPRARELIHATDIIAQRLDELQFTIGDGPCLEAFVKNRPQRWADVTISSSARARWSAFAVDAIGLGVRAVFAFPVNVGTRPLGVLEVYRRDAGTLTDREEQSLTDYATAVGHTLMGNWYLHAARTGSAPNTLDTVAIVGADNAGGHPFSRAGIHLAAGMIAVQLDVPAGEGLDRLRAYSYGQQRPISEVAADVISHRLSFEDHRDDAR
ncbi:hypothetical protein MPSYJ_32890 [Mycolicibacterium psychrotolerans]|uniref:GAF domain-containing protein n=1 Tax=Mycolicibacterium psychrotolerans TaxID=216929 RepID=A0A7I7MC28_9MYCO|nr:hypothetical protein MPSYJ_32890 [Mycolicibacterium psychrotolerans]